MTPGEGGRHGPGCSTSVAVRFAKPTEGSPTPVGLAAGAIGALMAECVRTETIPDGVVSVAIGPCGDLVDLWHRVAHAEPASVATVAASDQVEATFKAEPHLFAALAFAHVIPDPTL